MAQTSHLRKTLKQLVLVHLCILVSLSMDGLVAVCIKVSWQSKHHHHPLSPASAVSPGSTVNIMLFDFSYDINTIQPAPLRDKLKHTWLVHHLTGRNFGLYDQPQTVCENLGLCVWVICIVGALEGKWFWHCTWISILQTLAIVKLPPESPPDQRWVVDFRRCSYSLLTPESSP